jgi:hypothetical protein
VWVRFIGQLIIYIKTNALELREMIEESKIVKAISLMNKLTKQGELTWTIIKNPTKLSLSGDEKLNGFAYGTVFKDQHLRIFRLDSTYYSEYDTYEVSSHHRLSFIEPDGSPLWDFPHDRVIDDLYETVRYKTSNVESFFDKLNLEDYDKDDDLPF